MRKPLGLRAEVGSFAAVKAIEQAVKAQPHVVLAQAPGAVAVAVAAVFRQLALHAGVGVSHWFQCRCKPSQRQLTNVMSCRSFPSAVE